MSITAQVKDDTIKLPIHVPDGTKVTITLPERVEQSLRSFHDAASEYLGRFDGPKDLSTNPRYLDDFGK